MAKEFRLNATSFLLTFPQSDVEPSVALKRIEEHPWSVPLKYAIVCHEDHANGDPHLHAVVHFEAPLRTRVSSCFDFVCGKHPNIQACRSLKKSVMYVAKHGEYITSAGFPIEMLTAEEKHSKSTRLAGKIIGGSSATAIMNEDPGFFLMNKRKIEDMIAFCARKKNMNLVPWVPLVLQSHWSAPQTQIAIWMNSHLFASREFGAKDLYIFGPTGIGKTRLLQWLSKYCRIYQMPSEDFYDHYDDEDYDLVTFDEFRAQKTIEFLCSWCQSYEMPIKKKGLPAYIKKRHIPTIFTSNFSPRQNYHVVNEKNPAALDPLERRLEIVEISSSFCFD